MVETTKLLNNLCQVLLFILGLVAKEEDNIREKENIKMELMILKCNSPEVVMANNGIKIALTQSALKANLTVSTLKTWSLLTMN